MHSEETLWTTKGAVQRRFLQAGVAQSAERLTRNEQVRGSIPLPGSLNEQVRPHVPAETVSPPSFRANILQTLGAEWFAGPTIRGYATKLRWWTALPLPTRHEGTRHGTPGDGQQSGSEQGGHRRRVSGRALVSYVEPGRGIEPRPAHFE